MIKIWNIFNHKEKRSVLILLSTLLIVSALELFGLVLVIPYVNLMIDDSKITSYINKYPYFTWLLEGNYQLKITICFGVFYIIKNGLLAVFTFIQQTILKKLKANIMCRMFHYFMHQPYEYHVNTKSSDLVRAVTYDANIFTVYILQQGAVLVSELLLFSGVLVALVLVNPTALLIFIAVIIPVILIYVIIKRRLFLWGKILQSKESEVIKQMQDGVGGIKDTIVLSSEEYFESNFQKNVDLQARIKRNSDVASLMPRYAIETLMMVSMGLGLFWLSQLGSLESHLASIAFLAVVSVRILPMSNRIFTSISNMRSATASLDIVEETGKPISVKQQNAQFGSVGKFEKIEICHIEYGYENSEKIIDGVSFELLRGDVVGLVGESGAGKTTLVDIFLGLLPPKSGEILCDGKDIKENMMAWKKRIGYVQQSVYLMDTTIKENIAYGIPIEQINQEQVEEVIKLAKLSDWVDGLPLKSMSLVGERGVRVSGGQRQRIGIARALYRNPEILVLDEAASALDNNTEHKIMDDIYNLRGERTIFMIAHRLESIRRCDRILLLQKGKIVDSGTFEELMSQSEPFQKLANAFGEN